jgi:hexulose-6-phosphate isomerase
MTIGIMQGRLSPPVAGRLQAFPWADWASEFEAARVIGFDAIEWLYDEPRHDENPIASPAGRQLIRRAMHASGVAVPSLCAHAFIHGQLSDRDAHVRQAARVRLVELLQWSAAVGIGVVVLPLAEDASLSTGAAREAAMPVLADAARAAARAGIRIALELDLEADAVAPVLDRLDPECVGICYDIGNATASGRVPAVEIRRMAPRLIEVHVKDRPRGGSNVPLGSGAVDFDRTAAALREVAFDGPVTLETPHGDDPVATGRRHLEFVRAHFGSARMDGSR